MISWEYIALFTTILAFYLYTFSSMYIEFLKKRKIDRYIATMMAMLLILVIVSAAYILSQHQFNLLIIFMSLFVIIAPILAKEVIYAGYLKDATPVEYELDGRRVRLYSYNGPKINALYHPKKRRIYVHKELFSILCHDDLKAIIYHELRHEEQSSRLLFSRLQWLTLITVVFWVLGGLIFMIIAGYLFYTLLVNLIVGRLPRESLTVLPIVASLYLLASTFSLILTYAQWVWEHDADFYAAEKVGAEAFARALAKVYLAGYLREKGRYLALGDSAVSIHLNRVPPLTQLDVFRELLLQTLLARGFINVITKPLEETHPPLYLRLRALRTAF